MGDLSMMQCSAPLVLYCLSASVDTNKQTDRQTVGSAELGSSRWPH